MKNTEPRIKPQVVALIFGTKTSSKHTVQSRADYEVQEETIPFMSIQIVAHTDA